MCCIHVHKDYNMLNGNTIVVVIKTCCGLEVAFLICLVSLSEKQILFQDPRKDNNCCDISQFPVDFLIYLLESLDAASLLSDHVKRF